VGIISRCSGFLYLWNLVVFVFVLYNVFAIPFRLAFLGDGAGGLIFLIYILDYLGDAVFLLDIRLRSTSLGYFEGEKAIVDNKKIRNHYLAGGRLKGKSLCDILAIIPIEFLALIFKIDLLHVDQVFGMLRVLRLLRVSHAYEHIRCTDSLFGYVTKNKQKNTLKVMKLLVTILFAAHFFGCGFFFIAFVQNKNGHASWADCCADNDANKLLPCPVNDPCEVAVEGEEIVFEESTVITKYIRSIYWATTALTTAGYGDVTATTSIEEAFSIAILIFGTLLFATVIANLEEIVAQVDVTSTLFQQKLDEIKTFMNTRQINANVSRRASEP